MLQSYTRGQETTRNESNQALPKVWGLCGQSSRPPPACSQFPRAVGTNYTGYPSWSLLKVPPAGWWWSVWGRNRRNHEPYDRDKGDVLHACLSWALGPCLGSGQCPSPEQPQEADSKCSCAPSRTENWYQEVQSVLVLRSHPTSPEACPMGYSLTC